jgi:hypothetical protein
MTIKAGASTPTGTYTITVTGTGQGVTETTSVSLTVNSPDAMADPVEALDGTPGVDLQLHGVGSSSAEIDSDVASKNCPLGCWAVKEGAKIGAPYVCEQVIVP